jgi:hypothetical protein
MRIRSHLISCGTGVVAGVLLVAGLAMQPERGPASPDRPGSRQPDRRPDQRPQRPGDRERPEQGPPWGPEAGPAGEGPDGRPGDGRPPFDRDRAIKRLEERLATLDRQKALVNRVLERLRGGEAVENMGGELLEALRGPGGGGGGGGEPPRGAGGEEREFRRLVGEFDPKLVERMDQFRERHPLGGRVLVMLMPRIQEVVRAKAQDPELFELYKSQIAGGLEVGEFAMAYLDHVRAGKLETDEAKAARASLKDAYLKQFETRRKLQERDITALNKKIEELQARVNETADQRAASADAFIDRLARQATELRREREGRGEPRNEPAPR